MISIGPASDFSIFNLPWGVFSASDGSRKIGVAIGDLVLDCSQLPSDSFPDEVRSALASDSLNTFMGMGRPVWSATRSKIQELLKGDSEDPCNLNPAEGLVLVPRADVQVSNHVMSGLSLCLETICNHMSAITQGSRHGVNGVIYFNLRCICLVKLVTTQIFIHQYIMLPMLE